MTLCARAVSCIPLPVIKLIDEPGGCDRCISEDARAQFSGLYRWYNTTRNPYVCDYYLHLLRHNKVRKSVQ